MSLRFLSLPGDGIGPDIVAARAAHGVAMEFDRAEIGVASLARPHTRMPDPGRSADTRAMTRAILDLIEQADR